MRLSVGLLVFGIVLLIALWNLGKGPATHRRLSRARLESLLNALLNQGFDGGLLIVRGKEKTPFLQVMKYVGREKVGIQLDFPRAEWAEPYMRDVEAKLGRYRSLSTRGWGEGGNDLRFITIDFAQDVQIAAECIESVGQDALGIQLVSDGRAHLLNVSSDPKARIGFAPRAENDRT